MRSNPTFPKRSVGRRQDYVQVRISLNALHAQHGEPLCVRINLIKDGLTVAHLPTEGELELQTSHSLAAYAG